MSESSGVLALAQSLRGLQLAYRLNAVSGTMALPSRQITLRIVGLDTPVLEIEDHQGDVMVLDPGCLAE